MNVSIATVVYVSKQILLGTNSVPGSTADCAGLVFGLGPLPDVFRPAFPLLVYNFTCRFS